MASSDRVPPIFSRRVWTATAALAVLFAALAPSASDPLGFVGRLMFWAAHIGLGLICALAVARLLVNAKWPLGGVVIAVVSGIGGIVLFAPIAVLLERLFPILEPPENLPVAYLLAVEALELAPTYLACWLLLNIELLGDWWRSRGVASSAVTTAASGAVNEAPMETAESPGLTPFERRLPPAIQAPIEAVSSDMHYLHAVTPLGKTMLLGALRDVDEAYGEQGLLIHRSHWVRLGAVVAVRKAGTGLIVETESGLRLPVSRRRRRAVEETLGTEFRRQETQNSQD
ncbi:MAG: LytTR family DNA-binding domain-containing protein [Pseudomonadota bacterium]